MTIHTRAIAAVAFLCSVMTGLVLAQAAGTPAPQAQTPVGQTPPQGRGEGGRQGGGRAGGFTQYTRPPASPDVIVRGKALYETNCTGCHAADLRGTADGKYPNLLRSGVALRHLAGVENMLWSSDYPHHGNDWPYSRKVIDETLGNIAADERALITGGNATRIWHLD